MKTAFDNFDLGQFAHLRDEKIGYTYQKQGSEYVKVYPEPLIEQAINFTDKASYLAWVKDWRDTYLALAEDTRIAKKLRKGRFTPDDTERIGHVQRRVYDGHLAYFLLMIRMKGKERSIMLKHHRLEMEALQKIELDGKVSDIILDAVDKRNNL